MFPIIKKLWEQKKQKDLFDRQIKEAELERLKKSLRPDIKQSIDPIIESMVQEKPVAYGKRPDTHFSTEGNLIFC